MPHASIRGARNQRKEMKEERGVPEPPSTQKKWRAERGGVYMQHTAEMNGVCTARQHNMHPTRDEEGKRWAQTETEGEVLYLLGVTPIKCESLSRLSRAFFESMSTAEFH
jgi:hypothetical protein